MSKVIHLSDEAHNTAKGFCKQHGLKMSDWVAALIAEAIAQGRVDPQAQRFVPPPPPPAPVPVPQVVAPPAVSFTPPPPPPVPSGPPKKKLERFKEEVSADGTPPWAAPPFWAGSAPKSQSK